MSSQEDDPKPQPQNESSTSTEAPSLSESEASEEAVSAPVIKHPYNREELLALNTEPCTKFPPDLDLVTIPWFKDFDKRVTTPDACADEMIALKPQWGRAASIGAGRGLGLGAFRAASIGSPPDKNGGIHSRLVDNGTLPDTADTSRRPSGPLDIGQRGTTKTAWRLDRGDVDDRGKPIERFGSSMDNTPPTKPRWERAAAPERAAERAPLAAPEPPARGEGRGDNWRNQGGPAAAPRARWDDTMSNRRKGEGEVPAPNPGGPDPWADDVKGAAPGRPGPGAGAGAGAGRRGPMTPQEMEKERLEFRAMAEAAKHKPQVQQPHNPDVFHEANLDELMDDDQREHKYGKNHNGAPAPAAPAVPPGGMKLTFNQLGGGGGGGGGGEGGMKLTFNQLAGAAKAPEPAGAGAPAAPVQPLRVEDLERGLAPPKPAATRGPPPGMFAPPTAVPTPAAAPAPRPAAPPGFPGDARAGQALLGLLQAKPAAPNPAPANEPPAPAAPQAPPAAPVAAPAAKPALPSLFQMPSVFGTSAGGFGAPPGMGGASGGSAGGASAIPADVRNLWAAPAPAKDPPLVPADVKKAWDDVPQGRAPAPAQPSVFGNGPHGAQPPGNALAGGGGLLDMLAQAKKAQAAGGGGGNGPPQASHNQTDGLMALLAGNNNKQQQEQQQAQQQQAAQQAAHQAQVQQAPGSLQPHLLQLLQRGDNRQDPQRAGAPAAPMDQSTINNLMAMQQQQRNAQQQQAQQQQAQQQAQQQQQAAQMYPWAQQQQQQRQAPPGVGPAQQQQMQGYAQYPGLPQGMARPDALTAMLNAASIRPPNMMQQPQQQQQQQQGNALQELQARMAQAQAQAQQLRPGMPPPPAVLAGMPPPPGMHMGPMGGYDSGYARMGMPQGMYGGAPQGQAQAQPSATTDMARVLASLQGLQPQQGGQPGGMGYGGADLALLMAQSRQPR